MEIYNLEIELSSPALVGSGSGFGSVIDTDIVYDEVGLPFIPAKRVKGCLRDAAHEVLDMFKLAQIGNGLIDLNKTFGEIGKSKPVAVYFSDLTVEEYKHNRDWLNYLLHSEKYRVFLSTEEILKTFTEIRQQTAIDQSGIACEHSLRTIRVLRSGLTFSGQIEVEADDKQIVPTLQLAALNWRRFGTKRNRGYGEIRCSFSHSSGSMGGEKWLEKLCTD